MLALPVSIGLTLFLSSCGDQDTHGKIMADALNLLEELATTLEKTKDQESARSAAGQILHLTESFRKIAERSNAVGKPTPEVRAALTENYGDLRTTILARIRSASARAKNLNNEELTSSLGKLGAAWSSLP